jgi:hypothetical protein
MTKEEVKHVNWMYNRLTSVHKENPNYDYMLKFKEIIDKQLNIADVVGQSEQFICGAERVHGEERCDKQCGICLEEYSTSK